LWLAAVTRNYDRDYGSGVIRLPLLGLIVIALALATPFTTATSARRLVVCADPNYLPFSNQAGQGFENKLVELLARDLQAQVEYVWQAQHGGYGRSALGQGRCDLWPGVATGAGTVATTRPYYRSSYVFVTRADRPLAGLTLDDKRLKSLSIGLQTVGNDAMNRPPAHAIARRGLTRNVHGYMHYDNYDWPNPPAGIVDAVANRNIDVAMVWGPLAGYFAHQSAVPLRLEPVVPQSDGAEWPMAYDISLGVRRDDAALRDRIDRILQQDKPEIDALLQSYHASEGLN
jgi:mxaJ protein